MVRYLCSEDSRTPDRSPDADRAGGDTQETCTAPRLSVGLNNIKPKERRGVYGRNNKGLQAKMRKSHLAGAGGTVV